MEKTPLAFLHEIEKLKYLPKSEWLVAIPSPESVAAHSFRVAMLAFLAPDDLCLDRAKCIQMALCHDLAESVMGDVLTLIGVPKHQKLALQYNGFQYLESLLQGYSPQRAKEITGLWLEYEEGQTAEAKWVREMDQFEFLVQAHEYEQKALGQKNLREFQGLITNIQSPQVREWACFLHQERERHFARRQRQLPIIFITGNPIASEKVADHISSAFKLRRISVPDLIHERASHHSYPHRHILKNCLEKRLSIPTGILTEMFEKATRDQNQWRQWTVISGFPKNTEQLDEYNKKVQQCVYVLWVEYEQATPLDRARKPFDEDLKLSLMLSTEFLLELTGPEKELCERAANCVRQLILSVSNK